MATNKTPNQGVANFFTSPVVPLKNQHTITPEMMGQYLYSRDWALTSVGVRQATFSKRGDWGMLGIEIPTDQTHHAYNQQVSEVLVNLSIIEHQPSTDIYYDILRAAQPTLKSKVLYGLLGLGIFGYSLWAYLVLLV